MLDPLVRTVDAAAVGLRLDVFLAAQPEVAGRSTARRLLDAGLVQVAGERVKPSLVLRAGMVVEFAAEPAAAEDPLVPPGEPPVIRVLYEDSCLVAIDKPAGLAAHPPERRSFAEHTVASWAKARYGELPTVAEADRPGIVHRLDRDTSGVMVLARTQPALDFLKAQFRVRAAHKEYRAIVYGEPRFQSDWIERPIASDPNHPDRMAVVPEGGREAVTYYEVVERFRGFAHLRCEPKTGRTHQIRVHLTSIGNSLVGDRVYRSRVRQHDSLPAAAPRRHCLHALRLSLPHPASHEPIAFESPLPPDFVALLEWLRQNRPVDS